MRISLRNWQSIYHKQDLFRCDQIADGLADNWFLILPKRCLLRTTGQRTAYKIMNMGKVLALAPHLMAPRINIELE